MPTYEIRMIETVAQSRSYTVIADNMGEAELKALKGETVEEETLSTLGVVSRSLDLEK